MFQILPALLLLLLQSQGQVAILAKLGTSPAYLCGGNEGFRQSIGTETDAERALIAHLLGQKSDTAGKPYLQSDRSRELNSADLSDLALVSCTPSDTECRLRALLSIQKLRDGPF